jgi:hypothetical protein
MSNIVKLNIMFFSWYTKQQNYESYVIIRTSNPSEIGYR